MPGMSRLIRATNGGCRWSEFLFGFHGIYHFTLLLPKGARVRGWLAGSLRSCGVEEAAEGRWGRLVFAVHQECWA